MICSFECTFCKDCVERLANICPNCGGGFSGRPIRPAHNWRDENYLGQYPATTKVTHAPVDDAAHAKLRQAIGRRAPNQR